MRHSSHRGAQPSHSPGGGGDSRSSALVDPSETDPLLPTSSAGSSTDRTRASRDASYFRAHHRGAITRRHTASRSPPINEQQQALNSPMVRETSPDWNGRPQPQQQDQSSSAQRSSLHSLSTTSIPPLPAGKSLQESTTDSSYDGHTEASRSQRSSRSSEGPYRPRSGSNSRRANRLHQQQIYDRQQYYNNRANQMLHQGVAGAALDPPLPTDGFPQPLLEVPEEIFAVRRAALTVLDPLTYAWLIFTVGFSLSLVLAMSRWMYVLPVVPYWLIMLPAWLSHLAMLTCHVMAGRALSRFIADANENRQRQDTTDHLDRAEYLPLLQRSLKFGLKTGLISFCIFLFEILIYMEISRGSISLATAFIPIWIIVCGGIIDGVVCKTQHMLRVLCWMLLFTSMVLSVIKIDHNVEGIPSMAIISPLVATISIVGATLMYIVYGHQVGYFRLTEAQLTAGILYSMAALVCIVLLVVLGEVIPMVRPIEFETRLFMVTLPPLVMALIGVGAWAVSRDEFDRLLQFGGQAAVHPMRLKFEPNGWTCVESRGVTIIPMFGEVCYEPLDSTKSESIELCSCCACYPYEDEEETIQFDGNATTYRYMSHSNSISGNASRGSALTESIGT